MNYQQGPTSTLALPSRPKGSAAQAASHSVRHIDQTAVAQRWSVSPRTLERWRWTGQGPRFLKIGGRVVYRIEDIEAYEAEQLRSSTSSTTEAAGGAR